MIDTHVHLQHPWYAGDLHQVLERAAQAGIRAAIIPGTNLSDCREAVSLVHDHSGTRCRLHAAVGIHPTEAHQLDRETGAALESLAGSQSVVAIGEIGLDYYWPSVQDRGWVCAEPDVQRGALQAQLELASRLDLPVVIHDRDAHIDVLHILRDWLGAYPQARGTLHAYAAGPELLDEFLDMGLHIGIDGPVTYKKAARLHEVARRVPLSRLLLETDGPYLPPAPRRGERNEPAFIPLIAARIAELRGTTVDAVAKATTDNASRLFGLRL